MANKTVNVTEFKTKCLKLLDELGENGGTITVTRRGKPLATVKRARPVRWKSLEGMWAGRIDLPVDPVDMSDLFECLKPQPEELD